MCARLDLGRAREVLNEVVGDLKGVIVGKDELIKHVVAALVAGGHVLVEGPPGTAKTLLAKRLARAVGGEFRRIQGNPDLLPSDLTGYYVYSLEGTSRFVRGPVFTNFLMFDELNRTPTRVQSALLQAMAELQVSVDGVTHRLPRPFHVIATEVPVEEEVGVYPLTLTLRDRFWIKCYSTYNEPHEELEIVRRADELYELERGEGREGAEEVVSLDEYVRLQELVREAVHVSDRVVKYITDLASYIRSHSHVRLGPSHRGSIALYRISKVLALMDGRDYVIPDDVKEVAVEVLAHRIQLAEEAELEGKTPKDVILEALDSVEVPKE